MSLQQILGDMPATDFVAQFFQRLPFSKASGASALCELGEWDVMASVLAEPHADVMICRRNEQYQGERPKTAEQAWALNAEGYTILVRHAERHNPRLAELASGFERDFAAPVNIHMYATPAQQYGFGWHYDAEDVFIVQTTGRKEYLLRKNTVNPWPLEETLPDDMQYEREIMPLMRCLLTAGDWLYIPAGYWHMGVAEETAVSLAIGVMSHTALEAFDILRSLLSQSIVWRHRLPVAGAAGVQDDEHLRVQLREILEQLSNELSMLITSDNFLSQVIKHLRGGG